MPIKQLDLPQGVTRTPNADEVLRVFINADKNMDLTFARGFNDAATWGVLLADVARHLANGYADLGDNPVQTLQRIRDAFNDDLASQIGNRANF